LRLSRSWKRPQRQMPAMPATMIIRRESIGED
jgi:hypothetical protein